MSVPGPCRPFLPLALLALTAPLLAQPAAPGVVWSETGQTFPSLQKAVDTVGDGTATLVLADGIHRECAVQGAGDITYRANTPGQAVFDSTPCEGKAALVLRGRAARVEGLVFTGIKVPDFNGAGIRLEKGNLAVSQSWFRDSQQGILTGANPDASITIDKSTFTRLGTCEGSGGCAHSVYVGEIKALSVTRSRFEAGRGGHYLKSRAGQITVINNSFDDSGGRATNYMIDLSGGATGRIAQNWFVQGKDKENHSALIAVAAEGKKHSSAKLAIEGNDARLAPGVTWSTTFVANWSGDALMIGVNRLDQRIKRSEKR